MLMASLCCVTASLVAAGADATAPSQSQWDASAAAQYLDSRAKWWVNWPAAQRDHDTVCLSCHTMLPYMLSRPVLGGKLHQTDVPAAEQVMLNAVRKRVSLWSQVAPYYLDAKSGPGKSRESRATEAVLNAMVLSSIDAKQGHLAPLTKSAFDAAWALQLRSGPQSGAWDWQVFHLSPWEGTESQYQGATFMALAVGWAPERYRNDRKIQPNIQLLRTYLKTNYDAQPLLNRVVLLWASTQMKDLLSSKDKTRLVEEIRDKQNSDGGWSLSALGSWTRSDHTPESTESDGYATGIVTLALEKARSGHYQGACMAGRTWLENHQNHQEGSWRATSLKDRKSVV